MSSSRQSAVSINTHKVRRRAHGANRPYRPNTYTPERRLYINHLFLPGDKRQDKERWGRWGEILLELRGLITNVSTFIFQIHLASQKNPNACDGWFCTEEGLCVLSRGVCTQPDQASWKRLLLPHSCCHASWKTKDISSIIPQQRISSNCYDSDADTSYLMGYLNMLWLFQTA